MPKSDGLVDLGEDVGDAQHRLGRDAGVVEAAAADHVLLDHGGLHAELGRADRRHVAARPGSDDDAVVSALGHGGACRLADGLLRPPRGQLDARHRPDQEPEQRPGDRDDRQAQQHGRRRSRRPAGSSAAKTMRDAEQRLEAEHGPVAAAATCPIAAATMSAAKISAPATDWPLAVDLPAGGAAARGWRRRAAAASERGERHRARPLAGRERLERGARGRRRAPGRGRSRAPSRSSRVAPGRAVADRRLRLRCPNGHLQRGAQRARRGLGVGARRRSRARRRCGARRARRPRRRCRVEAADREPRRRARARPPSATYSRPRGGAAGLGRRRVHGPDGEVVDVGVGVRRRRPARARAWSGRRSRPARRPRARRRACRRPGRRARRRRRTRRRGRAGR